MAKKVIFKLGTFFVVLLSMVSAALYYGKKPVKHRECV